MRPSLVLACLLSISTLNAAAQGGTRRVGTAPRPRPAPDVTTSTAIFLTGRVVIDDGSVLTESAVIQTVCKGQKRTETHTDSHGGFSFQLGGRYGMSSDSQFDAEMPSRSMSPGRSERRDLHDCDLQASLAGFTSSSIPLDGRFSGEENADIGRITLHRLSSVEGFTISATSAQAPDAAKKALEKGQDQQKKAKWDDAQKSLERAVSIYPKFAVAWFELGRVQLKKNDIAGARHSFLQSLEADSKYINPYYVLSQLALREQNWQELIDFSAKLLALNPVNFPDVWLQNAIGHYYLLNLTAAEKSARRGLQIDSEHHLPKLEYLLGMILVKKPDYSEAAQHLRAFLSLTTKPAEVAEVQKQLDDIARLTADAQVTARER